MQKNDTFIIDIKIRPVNSFIFLLLYRTTKYTGLNKFFFIIFKQCFD